MFPASSSAIGIGRAAAIRSRRAFRAETYDIRGPFAIYVGRIDQNKGCKELFDFSRATCSDPPSKLSLVLIGNTLLPIPDAPAHPPSRASWTTRTSSTRWRRADL